MSLEDNLNFKLNNSQHKLLWTPYPIKFWIIFGLTGLFSDANGI
ncbi:hypothetical protein RINTHM_13540 [Richelia intracellularis HM01]|nr:hypothetical protein RINTHM_13540 [Richelia intracellularis HM01]